jgi:hypothetical protein
MTSTPERLHTTKEFEHWWENQGRSLLDHDSAKSLGWEAWRKGREQLSEASASQRLQPARR